MRGLIAGMVAMATVLIAAGPVDEVPKPFASFEHMIGGWKGSASPAVNKVKGWTETHGWAWKFDKGTPVGMTLSLEGDKTITKGALSFDPKDKKYHLDGTTPEGKPVAFIGAFSVDGKTLTLDRVGTTPEGKERLIVRPNNNKIRYTLQLERQATGAPQYKKVIEVGLTKDGESMAAGGGESNMPKCIMTGGASSIFVNYMGKSYPVCCTGCRDEFNDNPAKYAAKADAAASAKPDAKGKVAEKPAAKGKDDGSFDGLFDDAKPKDKPKPK